MDERRARVGQVIAEIRVLSGLTQADLAKRIQRSEPTVSRWENGKTIPSVLDIRALCDALRVPPDLLVYPPAAPVSPVQLRLRQAVTEGVRQAEAPPLTVVPLPADKRKRPR